MQANQQRDLGVDEVARRARAAALALAALSTEEKNRALAAVKTVFERRREEILAANAADQEEAAKAVEAGELSASLLRRLDLQGAKFDGVLEGLDDVLKLPDPVGQVSLATRLDEGLD
ncbi:MAG: gamma-glutamyl-phosphate reductase, partial [Planctomycetota bacterium]